MTPMPTVIDRSSGTEVRVLWEDGHDSPFPARDLRLLCPCAQCVDEVTGAPLLDPETVPADLTADAAALVGRYGVEMRWSDGHSTGIYTFENLRDWCPCPECREARSS